MRKFFLGFKKATTGDVRVSTLEHGLMLCVVAFGLIVYTKVMIVDFN
ncbi:hypothetical protein LG047_13125 [Methylocystis sp. WRRC1]|nr:MULTISPECIES: hypothetical protein [unclassified Methylocystis]MCC3246250.1 hypothetical protein [Methylocystis sp. WRRC1]